MKLFVQLNKIMEEHGLGSSFENDDDIAGELTDTSDLPTSLIITNLEGVVFSDGEHKAQFEDLFRRYEEDVTFQYFRSFRRARVNFGSPDSAAKARIHCHQTKLGESLINCYFAQPAPLSKDGSDAASDAYLQPPSPVRQFLISPPVSPPVGWEPVDEAQPVINYDLLSAVANLTPGEPHELHPASESQPSIVVHVCEEPEGQGDQPRLRIQQTRCPERKSSLDSPDSPSPPSSPTS